MSGKSDRLGNLLLGAAILIIILLAGWPFRAQGSVGEGCITRDNLGREAVVNVRSGPGLTFDAVGYVMTGQCFDVVQVTDRCAEEDAYCEWVELASIPVDQRSRSAQYHVWSGLVDVTLYPTVTPTALPTATPIPTAYPTPTQEVVPGAVVEFCRIEIQARDNGWVAIFERCENEELE